MLLHCALVHLLHLLLLLDEIGDGYLNVRAGYADQLSLLLSHPVKLLQLDAVGGCRIGRHLGSPQDLTAGRNEGLLTVDVHCLRCGELGIKVGYKDGLLAIDVHRLHGHGLDDLEHILRQSRGLAATRYRSAGELGWHLVDVDDLLHGGCSRSTLCLGLWGSGTRSAWRRRFGGSAGCRGSGWGRIVRRTGGTLVLQHGSAFN
ncbi:hypothetical protein M5D96_002742 [Drosophila gunungcola]|uniref:Secreted protein n=1 Tax=Drosophila gunungcola TaxID=103775 RepID=A0A9P9Z0K8_9MUSC|nr:hypothetical protein M5D96_002742 [Drosophila gunungcola]